VTISFFLLLTALAARGQAPAAPGVLTISPADSLASVSERLARDPSIREVVLDSGTYAGGWTIPPLAGVDDPAAHPLLIRAAEGARVVFDGARPLPRAKPVKKRPGVFVSVFEPAAGEPPKIWEPEARVRYLLAADLAAVERFPASYLPVGFKIYLHTPDGGRPPKGSILASGRDFGIEVRRPHVTLKGLAFRNFLARSKWSAAVVARADRVTITSCEAANSPIGFELLSDDGVLAGSEAHDVGCGAYLAGRRARVERNRFLKVRDAYVMPMYLQDDTGIQAYSPAEGATIHGNLAVGFAHGILLKARPFPWIVEENTLVAADAAGGSSYGGFLATEWAPGSLFRRNVVAGYDPPATVVHSRTGPGVERNCYSVPKPPAKEAPTGPGDELQRIVTGDPGFVDAGRGDYRLAPGSPCLGVVGGPIGADLRLEGSGGAFLTGARTGIARDEESAASRAAGTTDAHGSGEAPETGEARAWHVDPGGREGAAGTAGAPLRTIQAAVDRARPGDTILLHPGLYTESVRIDHGGVAGRPITLRATERWKAILDGARRHDEMIRIENAAHIVIRDLEVRWYKAFGIHVLKSPDVRVEGCRIWNAHRTGSWPEGNGVRVEQSPRFAAVHNVAFNQERGFDLRWSPEATITGNTAVGNLYAAVTFLYSIEGSTCTNNNFTYQGNDAIVIVEREGGVGRLSTLILDYNNYGLTLVPGADEKELPHLVPRDKDKPLRIESKAIVYWEEDRAPFRRFRTMEAWREFSSLDAHSIFADPLFVDAVAGDFRVERNSPNRGAGKDGADIGALTD